MPYLSASDVMFHKDALYQVYESLALPLPYSYTRTSRTHVTVITTALCLHGLQRCSHFSCSAVSFADVCVCVLRVNTNLRQYRPFSIHSSPTVYTVIVLTSTGVSLRPDRTHLTFEFDRYLSLKLLVLRPYSYSDN